MKPESLKQTMVAVIMLTFLSALPGLSLLGFFLADFGWHFEPTEDSGLGLRDWIGGPLALTVLGTVVTFAWSSIALVACPALKRSATRHDIG